MSNSSLDETIRKYSSWNFTIDHARIVDELTEEERKVSVKGIQSMRAVLGEDWLSRALRSRHPVIHYLLNQAPWTRVWLGEFGTQLEDLSKSAKFEKLLAKLTSPREFAPAHFELTVAHDFWKAGYSVEFYPKWKGGEYDFLASKSGVKFAVEASIINPAAEVVWASRTFGMLTGPYTFVPGLLVIGRIFKALSMRRISEAKKKIDLAITEVRGSGKPKELAIEGILDFLVLPEGMRQEAESWARSKGFHFGLEGPEPAHGYDEVGRIAKTMKEEYHQLPKDIHGVVALLDDNLGYMPDEDNYLRLVAQIEEDVYNLGRLSLLAIYFNNFAFEKERMLRGRNYVMANHRVDKLYSVDVLAIKNEYCDDGDINPLDVFAPIDP